MTGQRFCGSCGAALPVPPQPFCTSCGQQVLAAPVAAPPPSPPSGPPGAPELLGFGGPVPPADGRRRWPVVAAALTVLVLVGGGVAAVTLLRGGDGRALDGTSLPAAVTSEPEKAWTYDYGGDDSYLNDVVGVGDLVVLVDDNGAAVAVDSDGDEAWTADDRFVSYAVAVPGHDDLVIVAGGEGGGVGALSTDDGHELWWSDSGFPSATTEGGVLVADGYEESSIADLVWTDAESGDEKWRVQDVSNFSHDGDSVYVVKDGELSRLDQDSGKEDWTVEVSVDEESYVQVAAAEDLVAVAAGEVTAYDADGGDELWTYSPDDSDSDLSIGAYAAGRVYVSDTSYDVDSETSSTVVSVRDREGTVADIDVDEEEYFYGTGVEAGGISWFVDLSESELYDEDGKRVTSYDGDLTLVDKGVYAVDSNSVEFYEYGESASEWELDLPDSDSDDTGSVYAVDDGLLVAGGGEMTAYR